MAATLLQLAVVICLLHSSIAIRCYICQSRSNPACQDPMKPYQLQLTECTSAVMHASSRELGRALEGLGGLGAHFATDLLSPPGGYTWTPMHCQKISFYVGDEHVVVRGCQASGGWAGEPRAMCRALEKQADTVPGSYVEHCDICDRDACNAASPSAPPPGTLLLALLAALLAALLHAAR